MTPEQIRIKIAEYCGWIKANHLGLGWWRNPMQKTVCQSHELPDYLNDLNAMHEAEKILSYRQKSEYRAKLLNSPSHECEAPVFATAKQRAEAFLKTLNLWQE